MKLGLLHLDWQVVLVGSNANNSGKAGVFSLNANKKESKLKDGDYLTLQISKNDKKHVIFTGSHVLIDQIKKYKDEIPFLTTIRKINKYYSLT